jgi:hypothetical protein
MNTFRTGGPIRRSHRRLLEYVQTRCDYDQRNAIDEWQNTYKKMNILTPKEFAKLLEMIKPGLQVDEAKAELRTGTRAITAGEKLQMALRYFAGARVLDLCGYYGVSERFVYHYIFLVCDLLCKHPELQLKFPKTADQQKQTAAEFASRSFHGVLRGCLGAIDGWLVLIKAPSAKECQGGNVRSYFSGHYQTYGINVQACVDIHSRFTAVSMACPGKTNDAQAWVCWKLSKIIESFPFGYYLVGDNAYPCCDRLLTPFNITEKDNCVYRDSFNFYLSQLRIRVEMAFGLLVCKFRIFKKPLEVSLKNVHRIVHAAMVLHNFHITERLKNTGVVMARETYDTLEPYFGGTEGIKRKVRQPNGKFKRHKDGKIVQESIPADSDQPTTFLPDQRNHNDVIIRAASWHPWGHIDYDMVPLHEASAAGLQKHHSPLRTKLVQMLESHNIVRPN